MNRLINALILKSNRPLGAQLVEQNLISLAQLEAANEAFLDTRRNGNPLAASLLKILLFEHQSLRESSLLSVQIETYGLAGVSLDHYSVDDTILGNVQAAECRATWTVPIDRVGDTVFLASAYFLSTFVRSFWQERMGEDLVWLVSPVLELEAKFDAFQADGRFALIEGEN